MCSDSIRNVHVCVWDIYLCIMYIVTWALIGSVKNVVKCVRVLLLSLYPLQSWTYVTLVSEVGFEMAQWDITLPEIVAEDFERSWARFELVAKAKDWNDAKQLMIIPTLVRGKLLDYYLDLCEEEKSSMEALKRALVGKSWSFCRPARSCWEVYDKQPRNHRERHWLSRGTEEII